MFACLHFLIILVQFQTERSITHKALLGRKAVKNTQLGEKKLQSLGPRRHTASGRKRKISKAVKEAVETVE